MITHVKLPHTVNCYYTQIYSADIDLVENHNICICLKVSVFRFINIIVLLMEGYIKVFYKNVFIHTGLQSETLNFARHLSVHLTFHSKMVTIPLANKQKRFYASEL